MDLKSSLLRLGRLKSLSVKGSAYPLCLIVSRCT